MTDLIQLNDVEIAAVAGGDISQSASVYAEQSNSSSVDQYASAYNSGEVSASNGAGSDNVAAAAGACSEQHCSSHTGQRGSGPQQDPFLVAGIRH